MRLVAISDTHDNHVRLTIPDGDVLIHAGDFTNNPSRSAFTYFIWWLERQPHKNKILIAGNHDTLLDVQEEWCLNEIKQFGPSITYLRDSATTIDNIKFWGAPWQPEFGDWHFNLPRGPALAEKWSQIPVETDVLITHGPPYGILDTCPMWPRARFGNTPMVNVGCQDLMNRVRDIKPKAHIFGHIHESYGCVTQDNTIFANAAIMDGQYRPVNSPLIMDI